MPINLCGNISNIILICIGIKFATSFVVHEDINDVEQTVAVPAGHTSARDSETKKNVAFPGEKVTIIDTVYFSGLQAGQEYSITGTLYKKPEKIDKDTVPEPLK